MLLFFLMPPPPPRSTLFPYTTLFRSHAHLPRSWLGFGHLADLQDFRRIAEPFKHHRFHSCSSPSTHPWPRTGLDRKSTRLNSSHTVISYAVFCLKKKKKKQHSYQPTT